MEKAEVNQTSSTNQNEENKNEESEAEGVSTRASSPHKIEKSKYGGEEVEFAEEEALSYRLDLWNQINHVGSRIKQGGAQMSILSTFLKSFRKILQTFDAQVKKATSSFRKDFLKQAYEQESLTKGFVSFIESFESIAESIETKCIQNITSEIIEPLDLFHSHYNQTNSSFYSDAYAKTTELIQHKRKLLGLKEAYMKNSQASAEAKQQIEKAIQDNKIGKIKLEQVKKITDKSLQLNFKAETSSMSYKKQVETTNLVWQKFEEGIGPSFDAMQQSEHSRIQFIKFTLEKAMKIQDTFAANLLDGYTQVSQKLEEIEPLEDIATFIMQKKKTDSRQRKKREVFEQFIYKPVEIQKNDNEIENESQEGSKSENMDESYLLVHDDHDRTTSIEITEPEREKDLLTRVFNGLLSTDIQVQENEFIEATKVLTEARNRVYLAQLFGSTYCSRLISSEANLKRLSDLVINLLNNVILSEDTDYRPVYLILQTMQHFYTHQITENKEMIGKENGKVQEEDEKMKEKQIEFQTPPRERGAALLTFQKRSVKKRRMYLTSFLKHHGIWEDAGRWENWILCVIEQKLDEHDFYTKQRIARKALDQTQQQTTKTGKESKKKQTHYSGLPPADDKRSKAFFRGMASGLKRIFGRSDKDSETENIKLEDDDQYESGKRNIVFNILSNFVYYMSVLQLELPFSKPIILNIVEAYDLKLDKAHILMMELESSQRAKKRKVLKNPANLAVQSLSKRTKERAMYKAQFPQNAFILAIGLSLEFVTDPSSLINCLFLSKQAHQLLKIQIYQSFLSRVVLTNDQRRGLWNVALDTNQVIVEYEALKEKVKSKAIFIQNVEEVINVDVQRSFNHYQRIKPQVRARQQQSLLGILKTYAFYNPEVQYCQGMNFIAGMLYLIFDDQKAAFKVLVRMIDKYNLANMFNEDLPLLKVYFYQLERLISMFLPELHAHFKDESVQTSYYSSPWFITIHSNILQYHPDTQNLPPVLTALWDLFILHGLKVVFKFSLYLLSEMQEDLLDLRFEYILNAVNDLGRTNFFRDKERAQNLGKYLKPFKVTNSLLRRLQEEYTIFHNHVKQNEI